MMLSDNPSGSVEVTGERINEVSGSLCSSVLEKAEDIYYYMMHNGFSELEIANTDASRKTGTTFPPAPYARVIDILKDSVAYLCEHDNLYQLKGVSRSAAPASEILASDN